MVTKENIHIYSDPKFGPKDEVFELVSRELSKLYPHFESWYYEKVCSTFRLVGEERTLIVCEKDEKILGVCITKKSIQDNECKICTIYVSPEYRRQHIGTLLVETAIEILGQKLPEIFMTVPEELLSVYEQFLTPIGFKWNSWLEDCYRIGKREYIFKLEPVFDTAIISIQPRFVKQIMNGSKRVEYRRKVFPNTVKHMYIYSSYPQKEIVGYVPVSLIVSESPEELWKHTNHVGGISKDYFDKYFADCPRANAIHINEFHQFEFDDDNETGVPLRMLRGIDQAPQNWQYIKNTFDCDMLASIPTKTVVKPQLSNEILKTILK
jgi:predicted transcriptional regulator/GNAT superfamily N-acetyltransferase